MQITLNARPRRVFKDYSNRHSDRCWHENKFFGLMSAWKQVFRADIGMETSFYAGVGRNADWNNLEKPTSYVEISGCLQHMQVCQGVQGWHRSS